MVCFVLPLPLLPCKQGDLTAGTVPSYRYHCFPARFYFIPYGEAPFLAALALQTRWDLHPVALVKRGSELSRGTRSVSLQSREVDVPRHKAKALRK